MIRLHDHICHCDVLDAPCRVCDEVCHCDRPYPRPDIALTELLEPVDILVEEQAPHAEIKRALDEFYSRAWDQLNEKAYARLIAEHKARRRPKPMAGEPTRTIGVLMAVSGLGFVGFDYGICGVILCAIGLIAVAVSLWLDWGNAPTTKDKP